MSLFGSTSLLLETPWFLTLTFAMVRTHNLLLLKVAFREMFYPDSLGCLVQLHASQDM